MIEPKDVVFAVFGASAGLGGFVLVFLGMVISAYQSYSGAVPRNVVEPYRTAGGLLLGAFALSLFTAGACLLWLVGGGPVESYGVPVAMFGLQLLIVFGAATWVTRMVLWR